METQILRDPQVFPTEEVLKKSLGDSYPAFEALSKELTGSEYGLTMEWRYYKDGKSWLCKVCYKKKTIFWLSVWDKYFKVTFYFTERTGAGISELNIKKEIEERFTTNKPIGKLIPLTVSIHETEQIQDILVIAGYKKSIK